MNIGLVKDQATMGAAMGCWYGVKGHLRYASKLGMEIETKGEKRLAPT
jgi:hypothetical protein